METHCYQTQEGRVPLSGGAASGSASFLKHPLEQSLSLLSQLKGTVGFPFLWTVLVGSGPHAEPILALLV